MPNLRYRIKSLSTHYSLLTTDFGFTLIELMVVITILAILATIGASIYSGAQQNARDSRRRADIESIAKSLELRFQSSPGTCPGSGVTAVPGSYCPLQPSWFSSDEVPIDPDGASRPYCLYFTLNSSVAIANPGSSWSGIVCPDLSSMTNITKVAITKTASTTPSAGTLGWKVCASLENNSVFCRGNQQQ